MKLMRFFLTISFWIFLIAIIAGILYFRDYNDAYEALRKLDPGKPLSKIDVFGEYFAHSDQWNKIYMTIIISILLVLYVINDYWLKSHFKAILKKMQNFSYGTAVFGWILHKTSAAILVLVQFIAVINIIVVLTTEPYIFSLSNVIEKKKHALLLGTNKHLSDNKTPNMYYVYRINAVEELYKTKKISHIIISGDKSGDYNEPMDMKRDLLKRGIPESAIQLDYAGFRTLDSIIRLKNNFDVHDVTIITQKFHLQRAIFLAQFYNVKAVGFQAQGSMTKSMIQRELLAKPRVIMDIFVFNMQPKQGKTIAKRQQVQFAKPQHKTLVASVVILLLITAWFFIRSLRFQKY
jgi:vancomycin permeability regulator SanA